MRMIKQSVNSCFNATLQAAEPARRARCGLQSSHKRGDSVKEDIEEAGTGFSRYA